jgi:hypothetical protein
VSVKAIETITASVISSVSFPMSLIIANAVSMSDAIRQNFIVLTTTVFDYSDSISGMI